MSGDFRTTDRCANNRCPLPLPVGPSPALTALVDAQRLSLIALRSAIGQPDCDSYREIFFATMKKQLRLLEGTFRFCGAQSLEMLCWLMLELVQNTGDHPLSQVRCTHWISHVRVCWLHCQRCSEARQLQRAACCRHGESLLRTCPDQRLLRLR